MEFKIQEYTIPSAITFNFDELKTELQEKAKEYASVVYDESQMKQAKADRAALNKLKKFINDERIRLEREYMEPFKGFKDQVAEIVAIVDEPVKAIDAQIKEYEEIKRQEKMTELVEYFTEHNTIEGLSFEQILETAWLNASFPIAKAYEAISERLQQIDSDLQVLGLDDQYGFEGREHYKRHLDLSAAIHEMNRLKILAERKKAEEEAKQNSANEAPRSSVGEFYEEQSIIAQPEANKAAEGEWVRFKALLTRDKALLLRQFLMSNDIIFESI